MLLSGHISIHTSYTLSLYFLLFLFSTVQIVGTTVGLMQQNQQTSTGML